MRKTAAACIFALALGACATGYHPDGFTGGYSETQLSADIWQINVIGNGYTSTQRARNIAMLRAAEITLRAGRQRFVLMGGDVSQQYAGSTPIMLNRVGNTVFASGGDAIRKPEGTIVIRTVTPADPAFETALDAKLIDAQLRPQLAPR
jgi:hypothetical protein